jgi:hypothetical protein
MIFPVTIIEENIDELLEEGLALMLEDAFVGTVVESGEKCIMVTVEEVV